MKLVLSLLLAVCPKNRRVHMLSSKIAPWLGVLGIGAGGGILLQGTQPGEGTEVQLSAEIPTRQQQVQRLAASKPYRQQQNPFDVLIIGGGATGAGIAVDAATRCEHGQGHARCTGRQ